MFTMFIHIKIHFSINDGIKKNERTSKNAKILGTLINSTTRCAGKESYHALSWYTNTQTEE